MRRRTGDGVDGSYGDILGYATPEQGGLGGVRIRIGRQGDMTIIGAIFAGGASRRFGSDKALAPIDGRPMIAHVIARLRPQCDALVVVGREWPGLATVPDRPRPGLGPLGALCGALAHARKDGHELVLTSGCDLPDLPVDLVPLLTPATAVVRGQPLVGLWRAADADALASWLAADKDRAMRSWIAAIGAREVPPPLAPRNINTPDDMAAYLAEKSHPHPYPSS